MVVSVFTVRYTSWCWSCFLKPRQWKDKYICFRFCCPQDLGDEAWGDVNCSVVDAAFGAEVAAAVMLQEGSRSPGGSSISSKSLDVDVQERYDFAYLDSVCQNEADTFEDVSVPDGARLDNAYEKMAGVQNFIAEAGDGLDGHNAIEQTDPHNKFARVWNMRFAKTYGMKMRHKQRDGSYHKETKRRSHANTRLYSDFMRLGYLKQRPHHSEETGQGNYIQAQALLTETGMTEMVKAVKCDWSHIQNKKETPAGTKYAVFTKSNDETEIAARFDKVEQKTWMGWCLDRVKLDEYLEKEDIEKLKTVLKGRFVGRVHVLAQNCRLRFSPTMVRKILCPVVGVQRTSSSNLREASRRIPDECVSYEYVADRVSPYLPWVLIHNLSDQGSGPERFLREVQELFAEVNNTGVLGCFCVNHITGTGSGETLEESGTMTFLHRWSLILRDPDQHNQFLADTAAQALKRIWHNHLNINSADFADFDADMEYSDAVWDRIISMTVMRDMVTAACSHKLEPPDALDEVSKARIAEKRRRLQAWLDKLKRLVQFDRRLGFSRGAHLCRAGVCGPTPCDAGRWVREFEEAFSELCAEVVPHGFAIAKNRFLSWMKLLALTVFVETLMQIGPEAWLARYSITKVERSYERNVLQLDEDQATDSALARRDGAVRCRGVSRHWALIWNRCFHSCANRYMMCTDSFFRYCDRADTLANKSKNFTPLIFSLVTHSEDRNPMIMCFVELIALLGVDADLPWLIHMWFATAQDEGGQANCHAQEMRTFDNNGEDEVVGFAVDEDWPRRMGWQVLRHVLELYTHLKLKLGLPLLTTNPWMTVRVAAEQHFHGLHSEQAMRAGICALSVPECCMDKPLTRKVVGKPRCSIWGLLDSVAIQSIREGAPDLQMVNLDRERILSWVRASMRTDQAVTLTSTFNNSYVAMMRNEHEDLGGITVVGSSPKPNEIDSYQLDILMRRQHNRRFEVKTQMTGWVLFYLERIVQVWQKSQATKEQIEMVGGQRQVPNAKGKRARRKLAQGGDDQLEKRCVSVRKGRGAWHTWQSWFRKETAIYNSDANLRLLWHEKAVKFNEKNPRQEPVQLPPKPILSPEETWMKIGDQYGPLLEQLVKECCGRWRTHTDKTHPTAGRDVGPVTVGRAIRDFQQSRNMIMDNLKPGEELAELRHVEKICWEVRPGVCEFQDEKVMFVVKRVCCNLNTLCSALVRGALSGRSFRFEFVIAQSDIVNPGQHDFRYMYGDVWVSHVRQARPQVQMFLPMVASNDQAKWNFVANPERNTEIQATTSYAQVKAYANKIRSKQAVVHRIFLHEFWAAPTMAREHGMLVLKKFNRDALKMEPLTDTIEQKPICIFPDVLPLSMRVKRTKRDAKKPAVEITDESDMVDVAFAKQANENFKERMARLDKYLKEFRDKQYFPDLQPWKPKGGRKRTADGENNKAGPKGSKAAAGKGAALDEDELSDMEEEEEDEEEEEEEEENSEEPMAWEVDVEADAETQSVKKVRGKAAKSIPPPAAGGSPGDGDGIARRLEQLKVLADDEIEQMEFFLNIPDGLTPPPFPGGPTGVPVPPPPAPSDDPRPARQRELPADRVPKDWRHIGDFGPHSIFEVAPGGGKDAVVKSLSINCKRHADSYHTRGTKKHIDCRRNLKVVDGDREATLRQLKIWTLLGYFIPCECQEITREALPKDKIEACIGRSKHMGILASDPRLTTWQPTVDFLDSLPKTFTPDHLKCFRP